MFGAQVSQFCETALVALAPAGDAAGQPVLLVLQVRRHPAQLAFFLDLDLFGPFVELHIAVRALQHLALAQPERVGRDVLQEAAVVADDQHDAVEVLQACFQLLDHRYVEMVGRLVQQQHVRIGGKGFGERGAAQLAAGERGRVCICLDAEFRQFGLGHIGAVEPFAGIGEYGFEAGKVRLLRDAGEGDARLTPDVSAVGFHAL